MTLADWIAILFDLFLHEARLTARSQLPELTSAMMPNV
jgi:hypothetical protein